MKSGNNQGSENLIQEILDDADKAMVRLYDTYRNDFLRWARIKFAKLNDEDFLDIWQFTLITVYEKVQAGTLSELTCSERSYLLTIFSRRLINLCRDKKINLPLDGLDSENGLDIGIDEPDHDPWETEKEILVQAVQKLQDSCKQLLDRRYVDGLNIKQIMVQFGYTSENTVSASLSRCMKRLKAIVEEALKYHLK